MLDILLLILILVTILIFVLLIYPDIRVLRWHKKRTKETAERRAQKND